MKPKKTNQSKKTAATQQDSAKPARPLSGTEVGLLKTIWQTSPIGVAHYLGIAPNRLSDLKAAKTNELPPKFSLLLRYLLAHPEKYPSFEPPSPSALYEKVKAIRPQITEEQFLRMLGYQKGAPLRLMGDDPQAKPPGSVLRHMLLMEEAIDEDPNNIDEFIQITEDEAAARGQNPDQMWTDGWALFESEKSRAKTKER